MSQPDSGLEHEKYERPPLKAKMTETAPGITTVELPYRYDDGWHEVTVEWSANEFGIGKGRWVAQCSQAPYGCGLGHTREAALADLIGCISAMASIANSEATRFRRILTSTPSELAERIAYVENKLGDVQTAVTRDFPLPDDSDQSNAITHKALEPLWRGKEVLRDLARFVEELANREQKMRETLFARCANEMRGLDAPAEVRYKFAHFVEEFGFRERPTEPHP